MRTRLRTLLGGAVVGPLAVTVLVLGCVFVAVAGPRYSLDNRTTALRDTIASLPANQTAVQVSADWTTFATQVAATSGFAGPPALSDAQMSDAAGQLTRAIAAIPLPVTTGGWDSVTTNYRWDYSGITRNYTREYPVKLEVSYRPQLLVHASVIAGSLTQPVPATATGFLPVAASAATAAQFGLHVGSRLTLLATIPVRLVVTAIVRPAGTESAFWLSAPELAQPTLTNPFAAPLQWTPQSLPYYKGSYWVGGLFADPGTFAALQTAYAASGMVLTWEVPLNLRDETADQVAVLSGDFARATANPVTLSGNLRAVSAGLSVNSTMAAALAAYTAGEESVEQVLSLAAVSLTITGLALLMLAARLVASRRSAEFTMLRSRGGSLWQVSLLALRAGALMCLPAAALGAAAAVLATRGQSPPLAWWLGGVTAATAVLSLPATVAWQYRRPRRGAGGGRHAQRVPRRLVAEVTACAAAVGALVVLHAQGTPPGAVNFYVAASPALVAVPAVIVASRLYPLVIRALLALQARGDGATGFLAMAQAARTSLAGAAPAFALVLVLTVAAFSGMVQKAVSGGEVSASWQSTGSDALVIAAPGAPVSMAEQRAITALPGVKQVTGVWQIASISAGGQPITTAIVEPVNYAAYTSGTPFPVTPPGELGVSRDGVLSAVASPQAASELGTGVVQLGSVLGTLRLRVTGTAVSTPAIPGGNPDSAFLIVADEPLLHPDYPAQINQLLIRGSGISRATLRALAPPGAAVLFRSDVLAGLTGAPLQSGAYLLLRLSLVVAAGFALIIVMLGLALGSADRDLTLARLSTMGLSGGRLGRLVLYETMPAVAAAIAAAAACAVTLPPLISPGLDLSSFTGPDTTASLAPDIADIVLPALALVLLTAIAVAVELRHLRHRGIAALLRF